MSHHTQHPVQDKAMNPTGACGLYCGACPAYHASRNGTLDELAKKWNMVPADLLCHGCLSDQLAIYCVRCEIRDCCLARQLTTCADCQEFRSCALIRSFNDDDDPHHSIVLDNLEIIAETSLSEWLGTQDQRWRCGHCSRVFTWYEKTCADCHKPLFSCRDEELKKTNKSS